MNVDKNYTEFRSKKTTALQMKYSDEHSCVDSRYFDMGHFLWFFMSYSR